MSRQFGYIYNKKLYFQEGVIEEWSFMSTRNDCDITPQYVSTQIKIRVLQFLIITVWKVVQEAEERKTTFQEVRINRMKLIF